MDPTKKYICIHGHFYQPPRENAWLEVVEAQDSAAPFHDWNDRINFECYAPNTAARILDANHFIIKIINNYARISYNFGPTLLSWMEKADPVTYKAILKADRLSKKRFRGHGSALAQVHSHLILPLANQRDKETQVIWGIKDFEYRFGRKPEGIWLSETAVDTDTLEVLAENDIKFTILAPRQARAFRKIGDKEWTDIPHDQVDTRRPYLYKLPSGKSIALFFYNGEIAQEVAFKGLLNDGKNFAQRFFSVFDDNNTDEPQLAHIATDGESYGHHHHRGEMALADCLNYLLENEEVRLTNYGEFLELFPPTYEIQIYENSSWSCVHGVERWRSNCGCNTGGHGNWNQEWRGPLRDTLNWLRDQLIPIFEEEASQLIKDPWAARNDYISVLMDRRPRVIKEFMKKHGKGELSDKESTRLLRLMEMQRNAMLMFTSCGWFFDEVSGIETNQILQYANRAIYYANQVKGMDLHEKFIKRLEKIPSNVYQNGAISYRMFVMTARVDLIRVGMHYAVASLFEEFPEKLELFNYLAESEDFDRKEGGKQKLAIGRTTVKSRVTLSKKHFSFAAIYLGQHNIIGSISTDMDRETFDEMKQAIIQSFKDTDLSNIIVLMEQYFGPNKYSVTELFQDEKRKILKEITENSLNQVEKSFRDFVEDNYQLMTVMNQSFIRIPQAYRDAVEFVVNHDLHQLFENGSFNIRKLKRLSNELEKWDIKVNDEKSLGLAISDRLFKEVKRVEELGMSIQELMDLTEILETIRKMGIQPDIWQSQNVYFSMIKGYRKGKWVFASEDWKQPFVKLGQLLQIRSDRSKGNSKS